MLKITRNRKFFSFFLEKVFRNLWKLVAALQKPSAICGVMSQYCDVFEQIRGREMQAWK